MYVIQSASSFDFAVDESILGPNSLWGDDALIVTHTHMVVRILHRISSAGTTAIHPYHPAMGITSPTPIWVADILINTGKAAADWRQKSEKSCTFNAEKGCSNNEKTGERKSIK